MVIDWVRQEFESLDLGHKRRVDRVVKFVSQASSIGESTPDRVRSKADLKGIYRLANNPKVDVDQIFDAHHQAARKRCGEHKRVFLDQDSSEFDLTKPKQQVSGAGPLSGGKRFGFFYHPLYAVAAPGIPLGVVDQVLWTRDATSLEVPAKERKAERQRRCFEEKESSRWMEMMQSGEQIARSMPQTQFIQLSDSESDIGELLAEAAEFPENYGFIIRQCRTQKIVAAVDAVTGSPIDDVTTIEETLSKVAWRGEKTVSIGGRDAPVLPDDKKRARKQARISREALVQFRSVRVKVAGTGRSSTGKLTDTWINVVESLEVDPPIGEAPINWMLLTTLPVSSAEEIDEVLTGYCFRWLVELYFKTLKSGLHIEDMKYETLERYIRAFSMLTVVAWRVEYLKGATRHDGQSPCTVYFSEDEWMAIMIFLTKRPVDPKSPPTMEAFGKSIAILGGYINKKSQGPAGSRTLWRGMNRFSTIVEAFVAFKQMSFGV
ncbi:IS4 family transposase [Novipirellula sp. SH528]|uniref:IS4 family transposase n=1 Tax=Novipirellula sp. SH528 TaxID=3454466 RepID=UPI003F9F4B85